MTDRTPTTEAGRRLLTDEDAYLSDDALTDAILAIEAEARAELDVETLARAIYSYEPADKRRNWTRPLFDEAADIAAEYAALTRSKP
jgi:hypothetical protein